MPCLPVGVWDVLPKEQFHLYSPSVLVTKPGIYEAFILMSQESLCIIWYSSVSALKLCEKKKKKAAEFSFDADVFSEEQRPEAFVWQIPACNTMLPAETQTLAGISLAAIFTKQPSQTACGRERKPNVYVT